MWHPEHPSSHTVAIRLTAIEDCWVEFTKPDGAYLSQAYILAGNTKTWKFHHAVTMQIGNPGGILLTVNGQNLARTIGNAGPVTLSLGPGKKLSSQQSG